MNDEQDSGQGPLRGAAVYSNSFKTIDIWADATGFRTNAFRLRTLGLSRDTRVAEQFLLNSRLVPHNRPEAASIAEYFTDIGVTLLSLVDRGGAAGRDVVALPESSPLEMPLSTVLAERRSRRAYTGDPISFPDLAALCRGASAVTGTADVTLQSGGHAEIFFRTAASGGGLYSVQLYAAVLSVDGLPRGLYSYDAVNDQLVIHGDAETVEAILRSFSVPSDSLPVRSAAVVFLIVGKPWRAMRKYGDRGVRLMLMETGALSAHLSLCSTSLGLASLDCSSVHDDDVHAAMELDGTHEMLLHTMVVGGNAG